MAKQIRIYAVLITDEEDNMITVALVPGQSMKQVSEYYKVDNFRYIFWSDVNRVAYGDDKKTFGFTLGTLIDANDETVAEKDTIFFHPKEKLPKSDKEHGAVLALQEKAHQFLVQYYGDDLPEISKTFTAEQSTPKALLDGIIRGNKPLVYNERIELLTQQFAKLKQDFSEIKFAIKLLAKSWLKGEK